mgnify:FL=1
MNEKGKTVFVSDEVLKLLRIQSDVILSQAKMLEESIKIPPFSVIKDGKVIKKGKIV